tara:strand:- start:1090 stop:3210 length:2121 start_codon:yes stop_codon:yes gene_type:complete
MAFQLSPGVNISEVDLTNVTPAVATTEGAIAGVFRWGPTGQRTLITSEKELASRFGKPATYYTDETALVDTWTNHETWFSASNFLGYSDALFVTRVETASLAAAASTNWGAIYKGKLGNSIQVSHCTSGNYDATDRGETLALTPSSVVGVMTGFTTSAGLSLYAGIGDRVVLTNNKEMVITGISTVSDAASGAAVTFTSVDAAVVDVATNTIVKTAHGLTQGQAVAYSRGSGTSIEGLTNGQTYFVIRTDEDNFKLATTLANATATTDPVVAAVPVDITALGAGTSHTVTPVTTWKSNITFSSKYTGAVGYTSSFKTQWGDANLFDAGPSTNGIHVVARDIDGLITGTLGTVIERWEDLSTTSTSTKFDGSTNFITDVLAQNSSWLAVTVEKAVLLKSTTFSSGVTLTSGADGNDETAATMGELALGYDLYVDPAEVDISFIMQGRAKGATLANYIIDNIAEVRKDCIAFVSPELSDTTVDDIIEWTGTVSSSTYAVVDSGYKYQYDKYADVYRWIPMNADVAGLCARTDDVRDPWFSPAGYNRGNVKNVIKLLVNPNKSQRDLLYKKSINPIVTQPGQGTVLFGDKTFTTNVSAFDRINVRRLFIVLEKTIGVAAKSTLFEFNDEFTRAQFKNLVEPFLRDVQGRRGIYDFKVVCDDTNNTGAVIDGNQFVGDIFIKPARSINFIQLNFVAVRSGVEFSEIVGQF